MAVSVTEKMFGLDVIEHQELKMTAEDFGFYGSVAPSLFYRFGAGRGSGMAHRADFSPEDSQLFRASAMMAALAIETSCKVFEE
jgi:metal-dependent amidase/aminoacylase/carboxypeptidase family protein